MCYLQNLLLFLVFLKLEGESKVSLNKNQSVTTINFRISLLFLVLNFLKFLNSDQSL